MKLKSHAVLRFSDAWPLPTSASSIDGAAPVRDRWPREVILEMSKCGATAALALKNIPMPPKPLSYVVRPRRDCMAYYLWKSTNAGDIFVNLRRRAASMAWGARNDFHTGLLCRARRARPRAQSFCRKRKQPLREEHYKPVMPSFGTALVLDADRAFEDETGYFSAEGGH